MAFGVDYVAGPSTADLKAAGVTFVCRYLSAVNSLTQVKILTPSEAKVLSEAGISIVSNYEWYGNRSLEGYASGVADAQIAEQQHASCGGSSDRPIYFSVDVDTNGASVLQYFKGIASILGLHRTGAYGSYQVLKYLFDVGAITWGWQTYAWSYGAWEARCHIQQYQNGVSLSNHSVDYNRSMKSDFGQWQVGGKQPMSGVPNGWHDDGTTLHAANGVPIVLGFREYVLANTWDSANVPLAPQYYTKQLEASNVDLGDGDQIVFLEAMLCYPHNPVGAMSVLKGKVVREYIGKELNVTRDQVARYYPLAKEVPTLQSQIADLEKQLQQSQSDLTAEKGNVANLTTQLSQANAQVAQEQAQVKALQGELASHPDLNALANRLSSIGLSAKQASDLLAQVQQLAAQPIG